MFWAISVCGIGINVDLSPRDGSRSIGNPIPL